MPYCRIRPALTALCFSAVSCPRRVCRNPPGIRGLFWTLPPPFQPTPFDPELFPSTCANCRVPLSRQIGAWCVICRRLANYRCMDFLGKRWNMAGWHGFWTRTACMGVAWQLRCGSRLQVQSPPRRRGGRTEPCRDKLSSTLGSVMGGGIVPATVKTSHKVLPLPTTTNFLNSE